MVLQSKYINNVCKLLQLLGDTSCRGFAPGPQTPLGDSWDVAQMKIAGAAIGYYEQSTRYFY